MDKEIVISNRTTLNHTIKFIKRLARKGAKSPIIQEVSEAIKFSDFPEKDVFGFVYDSVVFKPDPENDQQVRTVERSLSEGVGNCVDYTVLTSAILLSLGIPHKYKVVAFDRRSGYEHIYVVTDRVIIDPVLGQKQDGTDTRYNRQPFGLFNQEMKYLKAKYYPMPRLVMLQGARLSRKLQGKICLTNCACKNDCSAMFAGIDQNLEKDCRGWCDRVKAKRNNLTASTDPYYSSLYQQALNQAQVNVDPYGGGAPTTTTDGNKPIGEVLTDITGFIGNIFGGGQQTQQPTYTPPPQKASINPWLIGGLASAAIGTGIYLATRKRKPKRRAA